MAERVTIERLRGQYPTPKPAWYLFEPFVMVRCGDCGKGFQLLDHDIDENGNVDQPFECQFCGWHAWARLEGWDDDE